MCQRTTTIEIRRNGGKKDYKQKKKERGKEKEWEWDRERKRVRNGTGAKRMGWRVEKKERKILGIGKLERKER